MSLVILYGGAVMNEDLKLEQVPKGLRERVRKYLEGVGFYEEKPSV